jgi:alkylation response protein AidB-like acyl-CoA dehydrogenase
MAVEDPFRAELRHWLARSCPAALVGRKSTPFDGCWGGRRFFTPDPDTRRWLDRMAERGLTAPTWPRAYGGGGLSEAEAMILREELAALRLPAPLVGFGLTMIGPMLLECGSEEQKQRHVPAICRGEIRWCQGYSEPNAGSDLASLACRAIRDGDDFVLNGEKVWTSYGDLSDWMFAIVRTDPAAKKQAGITFLLLDLETPGVSVRPTRLLSGKSPFCETRFENVRVPARNVLGRVDGGWTIAKALLQHERTQHGDVFSSGADGAEIDLVGEARERIGLRGDRLADGTLRLEIAQDRLDHRAFELTVQRMRDGRRPGSRPGAESSLLKLYASELNMRRLALALRVLGPGATGWEAPGFAEAELAVTRDWLRSRGNSIEGGTSEIQLNILAKQLLGLPD